MDLTETPSIRDPEETPPEFTEWDAPEDVFTDLPIRERLLDVILQVRDPTTVAEIADRTACDTETARDYLRWFSSMGMVIEHEGRPARYERNESFLRWRRIEQLATAHTEKELVAELQTVMEAIEEFQARFETDSPDDVSLVAGDRSVETTWEALSEWKTLEHRASLLDAARRRGSDVNGSAGRIDA